LQSVLKRAEGHRGTSFVEIYQNCNVFNDGAFSQFTEKETKDDNVLFLEHGKPLVFGKEHNKGIRLNGFTPEVVSLSDGNYSINDLLVHDETDTTLAGILADMTYKNALPRPIGVFLSIERPTYEAEMARQIEFAKEKRGIGNIDRLLHSGETWVIKQ
ncbi:MAG: 2-oxoacid:ferredoxin oxidoreductase subunit beta, partial [Bacteroidota bacterium]